MTDEARRELAVAYFELMDAGEDFMSLLADDAELFFPKWGLAKGRAEIERMYEQLEERIVAAVHPEDQFRVAGSGSTVVLEGVATGRLCGGLEWEYQPTGFTGRFCCVYDIDDDRIQRLYHYFDPDLGAEDRQRYPWLGPA